MALHAVEACAARYEPDHSTEAAEQHWQRRDYGSAGGAGGAGGGSGG